MIAFGKILGISLTVLTLCVLQRVNNYEEICFKCKGISVEINLQSYESINHINYEEGYYKIIKIDSIGSIGFFCGYLTHRPLLTEAEFEQVSIINDDQKVTRRGTLKTTETGSWREDEYRNFSIYYVTPSSKNAPLFEEILDSIITHKENFCE